MRKPRTTRPVVASLKGVPKESGRIRKAPGERMSVDRYAKDIPFKKMEALPEGFARIQDGAKEIKVRRPRRARTPKF